MKEDRISQTALKVALGLITLSIKSDWSARLPPGLVNLTEELLLSSGAPGYGPALIRASKKPWMIKVYEFQDRMMPGQWQGFGHRKIFVNEQVDNAIESGAKQVLILGAGFDTLCLRLAPRYPAVRFFELDHPATSAAKAKGVARCGSPDNLSLISVDLANSALSVTLSQAADWNTSDASLVVAEGLLQYLDDQDVHQLFREVAKSVASGSRFVFTHAIPQERRLLQSILRLIGEPFRSSVSSEGLPEYLANTGWKVISDVDDAVEHGIERYAVAQTI
ncbi:MAG: class I SAM-dependent methyltransferase [Pseudomonadales bacterium]